MVSLASAGKAVIKTKYGGSSVKTNYSVKSAGQEVIKAMYRSKDGGYVIRKKTGRTSQKDPFVKAVNQYLNQKGAQDVSRIYSSKSRIAHGAEGMWGVKLADGTKGWITERGTFVSQDDVRNVLHSVDSTNVGAREGISLEGAWDAMSPAEKARFAKEVDAFDWETFWKEMYPAEGKASDDDTQTDLYYELLAKLKIAKKW